RLYGVGSLSPSASLLMVQVGLAVLGNLVLLTEPAVRLIVQPSPVAAVVRQAGTPLGWLALLLALTAATWYTWRWLVGAGVSLACGTVLALGVLAACTAARWDTGDWLAYHVLTLGCALSGLTALAAGRLSAGRTATSTATPTAPFVVQAWVWMIGALVSGLALRGAVADVGSAWWSAGPLLSVSAMAGLLALWQRREIGVFAAALGVNAAVAPGLGRAPPLHPVD